ncbi:E3 ubiquitin/ISG15 ligase TRIM25-like [Mytilus trossulus]|uniref:E3 ubiquitin/ISG15 ligase TRIM25-like n=1 Tax=Mytilus trossulus TaxID=6551 RepID=UPI0030057A1A
MASESTACGICVSRHITKPSTAWCFECNEGLCEECKEHHTLNKASKSHGIIPVTEFQKLPVSVLQIVESCKSHNERYQAYCEKHECACCTKCLIEDHKNCKDLTDINDVVCSIKSSNMLLEIEKSMREVVENLQKIKMNRARNLSSLKIYRETIEKEIQTVRQTINEHFNRLERELLKELQTIENDERKKISKILTSVERKEKEIGGLQISLTIIKQHASDLQTFLVSKQIEHVLMDTDSLMKYMQDNSELSDVIISLQTDNLVKGVNENISRYGEIVVHTSQNDLSIVRQKMKQAQATVTDCPDHPYETIETAEHENDPCFIVTVKPGAEAMKLGLNGQYRLCFTPSGFVLEDIQSMTSKCYWPYKIVQQYGKMVIEKEFLIRVVNKNTLEEFIIGFICSSNDDIDEIFRLLPGIDK